MSKPFSLEQYWRNPPEDDGFRWLCDECRPEHAEIKTVAAVVGMKCYACGRMVPPEQLSLAKRKGTQ